MTMNNNQRVGITGTGYCVPTTIRKNDAPIFDWLHAHPQPGHDLFQGYDERHVLAPGETLIDIMAPAAQAALDTAGLNADDIDVLMGYASVSEFVAPNELVLVHKTLQLRDSAWIMPIDNQFINFPLSVMLAQSLIETGRAWHILVVCGGNWTRYVNYHTPPSVSAGDGAGAAVISATDDASRFTLVDSITSVLSSAYGFMTMVADDTQYNAPENTSLNVFNSPTFHMTSGGQKEFVDFGEVVPSRIVKELLARNDLDAGNVTLISHQASSVLMDEWNKVIKPGQYINSIKELANMTLATIPVNLAKFYDEIKYDNLVLLGLSMDLQASALLLKRN
jgi:3-oxoacyl-[acyl-carrier-protein] synthase-3